MCATYETCVFEFKNLTLFNMVEFYFYLLFFVSGDALATTFSALYGKLLVVMGIAFPMAEVISTYIPPSFYEVSTHPYIYTTT